MDYISLIYIKVYKIIILILKLLIFKIEKNSFFNYINSKKNFTI